ncbi:MAG: hypothetical protein FJ290_06615 [Planctomycetes bacterium]|nr:hypothetical protein [Planctomycetota bacterium]
MFDDVIRELGRAQKSWRIPIPTDEEGYLDRRCPSKECHQRFKLLCEAREGELPERGFCPFCGGEAGREEFLPPEQREYLEKMAILKAQEMLEGVFRRAARHSRPAPRDAFIRITLSYKPSAPPIIVPLEAAAVMQQKFACEECGCRYAAVGTAFFCPACRHNSAPSAFKASVETVRNTVSHMAVIREALASAASTDVAADVTRQVLERTLETLVGSFQRYAEAMFAKLPAASGIKVGKNAFQRLGESQTLWKQACGEGYEDWLSPQELAQMNRLYQQRHILAHRDGIVDEDYIDRSGDRTYCIGQRLVIQPGDVLLLADLVTRLAQRVQERAATRTVAPGQQCS